MREKILELVKEYHTENIPKPIIPGESYIPVSGKVIEADDLVNVIDSSLDMWFTTGRYAKEFEKSFAVYMEQKFCLIVNSGSSANLVAFSALTSPLLKDKALKSGDEVITVAAGFPTTINPIIQNGCVPVFIDVDSTTHNIDTNLLEDALSSKTKAIMIAHALGNPFNIKIVKDFCDKHNLWLVEDCCDAIGAEYDGKKVGTFGDIATVSFYPAHHITMGEGGAVLTNNSLLKRAAESYRDWGRDCWCPTGVDNSCKKRFDWQIEDLPRGYDHKYIYSHIGYNLKVTDMQAALGVAQLKKLPAFISKRRENFNYLKSKLIHLQEELILPVATENSNPSWFGFPISVKETAKITRNELTRFLEDNKIGTRLLFGGNLLKHPLYKGIDKRIASTMDNTDSIMNNTFWVGVFPALNKEHLDYIALKIEEALKSKK